MRALPRRPAGRAAALLAVTASLVAVPAPALAHGGPIAIDVRGDGGRGVVAVVTYTDDKHPVSEPVAMTFTATDAGGRTFGPARLVHSPEGQAFYVSERPLPPGTWTVTVQATSPEPARATARVTAIDPAAGTRPMTAGGRRDEGGWPWLPVTGAVLAGLAVLTGAVLAVSAARRRTG